MRLQISIDMTGFDRIVRGLESAVHLSSPVGETVAAVLRADILHQFQVGGVPSWRPLAASTIAQKRAQGYPRLNRQGLVPASAVQGGAFGPQNILERTMRLFESWTNPRHPEHVSKLEDGRVVEGTSVPYSGFHQTGGRDGKRPPKRPIVITEAAMRAAAAAIAKSASGS